MTIRTYESPTSILGVWMLPTLFMLAALFGHMWSGALAWPIESVAHQRDFNTALAFTLLTGVFWASVRAIHRNVASTLLGILLKRQQLNQFNQHRLELSQKFSRQAFICCALAAVMPIFYISNQGLLVRITEPQVFLITLTAIPFWLFLFLFLSQVTTNTRYVFRLAMTSKCRHPDDIDVYKSLFDMAISNAIYAFAVIAVLPVFWFNRSAPVLDMLILLFVAGILSVYLFAPVWRSYNNIRVIRSAIAKDIDTEFSKLVRNKIEGQALTNISAQLEALYLQRDRAVRFMTPRQQRALLLGVSCLPVPLLLMYVIERLA